MVALVVYHVVAAAVLVPSLCGPPRISTRCRMFLVDRSLSSSFRSKHVHYCLLKQPSSAKKPPPPADVTPTATRVLGSANRPGGRGLSGGVSGSSHSTSTPCGSRGPEQPGTGASGRADTRPSRGELLPDSTESPRSTRVSLQGVFSSKVNERTLLSLRCERKLLAPRHIFVATGLVMYVCGLSEWRQMLVN